MSAQGGDTRIELLFRLEAAFKRIEALEEALRKIIAATGNTGRTSEIARAALALERDK